MLVIHNRVRYVLLFNLQYNLQYSIWVRRDSSNYKIYGVCMLPCVKSPSLFGQHYTLVIMRRAFYD